ncbi:MAG TPA: cyclase family protein [Streptosporangiaceae bacterium]|jgi:kynurenine formamidase
MSIRAAPFGFHQVVFLSHVLGPDGPVFPGDPPVRVSTAATIDRDGFFLQRFEAGEQAGTHWAAPAHFATGGASAGELDAADFFFPAAVLDVRALTDGNADFALSAADIARWESAHGHVPEHAAVLLSTGYDGRWHDPAAYLGSGPDGRLHYPGFGADAARFLVQRRGVGALGTDTMGIDPGADSSFGANRVLLGGHRMHLENLCGLDQLPATGAWIVVGGVRIAGGSGSPATVFGLVP